MDFPLGAVTVVTPGTPVSVVAGLGSPAPIHVGAQAVAFQALPTNIGVVYIGHKGMVRASYVGVMFVIPAPGSAVTGPFITATLAVPNAPAALNVAQYFIDANNTNDGVLVTYTTQ